MSAACIGDLDTGFATLGYARVAFLGIVQGLTELMPIPSTAHMRIVPALFGWTDPGSAFSAAMKLAALAAVVACFRKVFSPSLEAASEPWGGATLPTGTYASPSRSCLAPCR